MITERKTKRKTALSAVDGGGKIVDAVVEVVKNTTDSVDHWDFLDQIEAPMWADLSLCNLTNDETNDSWFDISHQFHQCSSSQLLSTIFHPNSITIQEPPSPKLPPSVSKSRGKSFKIKAWGQRNKLTTSNNQHPVKSLTMNSSTKKKKPSSNEALKVSSSCQSNLTTTTTNTSKPKVSKSSLCSLTSHEQEHQSSGHSSSMGTVTSNLDEHQETKILKVSYQTSDLLSSLRNNLRRSCATRPAARMVVSNGGRCSEGFKSSSSQSSANSSSNQGANVTRLSKPLRNKSTAPNVTNAPAQTVRILSNRKGSNSNTLTSKSTVKEKVLVRKHTSLGKVLMPHNVNEKCKVIDKEGKRAPVLGGVKKPAKAKISTCQKSVFSAKEACLQETSKQNVAQKNGSKKLIGVKEKVNTRNRDKDTTRKVYFR